MMRETSEMGCSITSLKINFLAFLTLTFLHQNGLNKYSAAYLGMRPLNDTKDL